MSRVLDALRGMVGLVQLVQERYPDFPVDNHRVIEAISALNEASITRPEALRREPTEEMIEAGADAFLQAKDAWQAAQPKNYGAFCPLMVTLPAAYKAMVALSPQASAELFKDAKTGAVLNEDGSITPARPVSAPQLREGKP